jgi:hypothetical protein
MLVGQGKCSAMQFVYFNVCSFPTDYGKPSPKAGNSTPETGAFVEFLSDELKFVFDYWGYVNARVESRNK